MSKKLVYLIFFISMLGLAEGQALGGYRLQPISGADGVFQTVIIDGVTVYSSFANRGSYDPYMYFRCSEEIRQQPVYLEVTYKDIGYGMFGVEYNSRSTNYQIAETGYENYVQGTGRERTAVFELTNADFRNAQNLKSDLRLFCEVTFQMNIVSAYVYLEPTRLFLENENPLSLSHKAVKFDAPGDFLEVPHSATIAPLEFTIELWFKVHGLGSPLATWWEQTLLHKPGRGNDGYNIRLAGKQFPLSVHALAQPGAVWTGEIIKPNIWYHLAAVKDSDSLKMYFNGLLANYSGPGENQYPPNTRSPLRIGEHFGDPDAYLLGLRGSIDELRIWNHPRSQSEIVAAMHEKLSGNEQGLGAYWDFDELVDGAVADLSPNSNDAILHGQASLIPSEVDMAPPSPIRPDIADPHLVGWWKLDDGSGTTAIDSSGNGFDIPLHNTRNTTWEDGVLGGALHFRGTGHGHVENFNYSDNAITVCAWVRHDAFRIGEIERYITVAPEVAVIRKDWDGSLNFYIKTDGNLGHLWGNNVLREGRWYHVAGTWDGLTQRLYIDGVEIASQVRGGVLGNTSNVEMCSEGESFNGMLDDVRIYNRAQTQEEIQVIMQGEEFPYASNPYPADGAVLADTNVTLSWEPGFGAILHYLYFGDDYDVVSNATGGMPCGAWTYSPGTLDSEKTYYWRIDEVDGVTTYKGDVWNFSIITLLPPPESTKIFDDDFSSDSGMWTYAEVAINDFGEKYPGSAYRDVTNEYLVLTENRNSQCGVVWLNQDIFSPFTVEFKYLAGGSSGRWSADGLVFMFYKKKDYEPLDGGSLGFMTIPQPMTAVSGYGIEFDNYENDLDFPDPSGNHIALIEDSVSNHLVYRDDSRTEDNRWHDVRVTVGSSTIEVYVDNEMLFTWEGLIERTYGGIGFGAGTGAGTNRHLIDDVKIYQPPPPSDLSEALDTALSFTTGGDADWFSQTTTSYYEGEAAQSGDISHNQESWIQTTVSGAGTVSFYWKVSSEEDEDFLEFYVDGSRQEEICGSEGWEQEDCTISTSGSHTLEWRYVKDGSGDSGSDCGWVDKVEWVTN